MASTNRCTSFPYILYHTCTHTQIYVCVCVRKSVRPAFLLPLSIIPHLRGLMDHQIPRQVQRRFIMEACHWRPSYQDILTGVQLRLPTHDELKVLETVALTSCFCLCTPKAFSVTLSLPRRFKPFSSM